MAMTETLPSGAPTAPPAGATASGAARDPRRYARPRRRWLAALKALRRLLRDKEDTGQVFEIMGALNGPTTARNFERLLSAPAAGAWRSSTWSWRRS